MMKIVHEKYKSTKKTINPDIIAFQNSFEDAIEANKELGGLVKKAQELLSPMKVLALFENIIDQVRKCLYI